MPNPIKFDFPESDLANGNTSESDTKDVEQVEDMDSPPSISNMAKASLPPKTDTEEIPAKYTLDTYYQYDEIAKDVLRNKYLAPLEKHPWELWVRQARAIAGVEATDELKEEWGEKFLSILEDFRFVPGGRIMHGAGREDIKTTLNNCYVVAIKQDSIHAIYQAVIDEALTYKYGGGCGHDLSALRPSGSPIGGTGGESCGPTGFMDLFSINTNTIAQHGRRGANMQTLRVDHPDIEKFITIKTNLDKVKYSNISVLLTHEFMLAVEEDQDFELRWGGQAYRRVPARELWNKIITAAHASAEPGLIFWDTMRDYHNGEYCSPLVSTNPCAEQPLPDGGCCNLGSINLERFVDEDGQLMMDEFKETVNTAIRFLDNVIDYNIDRHALPAQRDNALNDRRIGLGILGLGDMLVRMHVRYDSEEALEIIDKVMADMRDTAYEASINLAIEKGAFPNFDWKGYRKSKFIKNLPNSFSRAIRENGIRNVTILTVAPTGSGAIVAQVTSGIEPIFATSYQRRVKQNEDYGDTFREYTVYHPVIKNLFGNDKELPDYVITSHDIDPYCRVRMQGVIQKYVDSSISSTVNLPEDIGVDTIADIYLKAYHEGLKGITVYREGSREGILITNKDDRKQAAESDQQPEGPAETAEPGIPAQAPSTETADSSADEKVHTAETRTPELHPRRRPEYTYGVTRRIHTGEGNLYITINEDEEGLCEIFTTIGKAGGVASAQAEAISRLISLALRSGIDAREVSKQLKGISGPNPTWENGRLILSPPDAIGRALDDYLQQRGQHGATHDSTFMLAPPAPAGDVEEAAAHTAHEAPKHKEYSPKTMTTCPDCGGPVFHESGCVTCPGCGYSRC